MKNSREHLTKENYNYIQTQKVLFGMDIVIGMVIVFVLANLAMLFTKNIFLMGILPLLAGGLYAGMSMSKRYEKMRAYWKNNE